MRSANTSFVDDSLLSSFPRLPLRRLPTNGFCRFYRMNGEHQKRHNPHGVAPETLKTVLLLVDVINDFDFPQGEKLLRFALPAARRIAALKTRLNSGPKNRCSWVNTARSDVANGSLVRRRSCCEPMLLVQTT
jgi:hypothetical protein